MMDDCECTFDADANDPDEDTTETAWHYARVCSSCRCEWRSLHCRHDACQTVCPGCGWLPAGARTPMQILYPTVEEALKEHAS